MTDRLRVITFNVLSITDASGRERQEVVRRALPGLAADVVGLQEVTRSPDLDQAGYLLGEEFTVVDLPGRSPTHTGECLASRWPLGEVATLEGAVVAEVLAPPPFGPLLAVHHRGTFELPLEHVREQQALAVARFVEDLVADRPEVPVVLFGDLNADPDAASIRFLTGRQSLDGTSVRYEDAWAATHPGEAGHTFSPRNALVRAGQMPLERGRRIDYVMTRSGAHGPLLDVADCRLIFDQPVDGVWASDHFGVLADLQPPDHAPGTWA
jgi:endonuclease/exonuclease/phosphatase family metal-dependent hydrolase